jgi:hypothetical protein
MARQVPAGPGCWHHQRRTDYRLAAGQANRRLNLRDQARGRPGRARGFRWPASRPRGPGCAPGRRGCPGQAGVCGTDGCTSRVMPPFRHALSSAVPPEMNKRGHRMVSALSTELAGVPGLEPRLTGPEPVGLPITPYPNGIAPRGRVRSRSLADRACVGQHGSSQRLDHGQAGVAVQAEPAGNPGRAQEGHVVTGRQDRAAVALQRLGELPDRGHVQVVRRLVQQ